ncbi:MAG: phosphonate ABC transporter, permease protein PhnE, partial [Burkholderiales bacterium]|nr:phosphonate ABC transporter, permease protein PhnE [Burkholderiales bacterium]
MKRHDDGSDDALLPPPLWDARCKACWISAGLLLLVLASFWSLDLQWAAFFSSEALQSMVRFAAEFWPPDTSEAFLRKLLPATWETLAMSLVGTLLAALLGLLIALPASGSGAARAAARTLLNA